MKRLYIRPAATDDIDSAVDYLLEESVSAAHGFLDAVENAFHELVRHPGLGSPRFEHLLTGQSIRSWLLTRYPYMVFYRDLPDAVEVIRVLHTRRDVVSILLDGAND